MAASGRIVVGVDGSDGSRRAFAWALDEARLRGWAVLAVHGYSIPALLMTPDPVVGGPPQVPEPAMIERFEEAAEQVLTEEIERVDAGDVKIERQVAGGPAADVIIQAAGEGDLVVVGSRGRGGFKGLLLGSVSQQVTHHAPCPVVIVPPKD